jgi:hypothetical protein
MAGFAREKPPGPGSVLFGGRNGLICLFSHSTKYATTGGVAFAVSYLRAEAQVTAGP